MPCPVLTHYPPILTRILIPPSYALSGTKLASVSTGTERISNPQSVRVFSLEDSAEGWLKVRNQILSSRAWYKVYGASVLSHLISRCEILPRYQLTRRCPQPR
eukprot:3005785-Rhodomonas_salina.4